MVISNAPQYCICFAVFLLHDQFDRRSLFRLFWTYTKAKWILTLFSVTYSWATRGSVTTWSSPAPPVKSRSASTNRNATTSESALRELSTASTARNHSISKTSRWEIMHAPRENVHPSVYLWNLSNGWLTIVSILQGTLGSIFVRSYTRTRPLFRPTTRSAPSTPWSVKAVPRRKYPGRRWVFKVSTYTI